jgi:hypothetical protein
LATCEQTRWHLTHSRWQIDNGAYHPNSSITTTPSKLIFLPVASDGIALADKKSPWAHGGADFERNETDMSLLFNSIVKSCFAGVLTLIFAPPLARARSYSLSAASLAGGIMILRPSGKWIQRQARRFLSNGSDRRAGLMGHTLPAWLHIPRRESFLRWWKVTRVRQVRYVSIRWRRSILPRAPLRLSETPGLVLPVWHFTPMAPSTVLPSA